MKKKGFQLRSGNRPSFYKMSGASPFKEDNNSNGNGNNTESNTEEEKEKTNKKDTENKRKMKLKQIFHQINLVLKLGK